MVIVSQDKRETINFDNVKNIKLDPVMDYKHIVVNLNDGCYATIGGYETEERAKKVLKAICGFYSLHETYKTTISHEEKEMIFAKLNELEMIPGVYEMPQK